MLSSLATVLHLLSETIYGGQEVLAVAGIILMSYFHSSFFSFLFLLLFYVLNSSSSSSSFFFFYNLKLALHLQLLQSIGYTPHVVQHIGEPILQPVVCISHFPPLYGAPHQQVATVVLCIWESASCAVTCTSLLHFSISTQFSEILEGRAVSWLWCPFPIFFFFPQWLSYTLSPCSDWKHLGSKKGLLH